MELIWVFSLDKSLSCSYSQISTENKEFLVLVCDWPVNACLPPQIFAARA